MILVRFVLIGIIVYLIIRSFSRYGEESKPPGNISEPEKSDNQGKKVSKEIGEYVDYEEIKDKK
jgi:large-conductance mechanosensitive channel